VGVRRLTQIVDAGGSGIEESVPAGEPLAAMIDGAGSTDRSKVSNWLSAAHALEEQAAHRVAHAAARSSIVAASKLPPASMKCSTFAAVEPPGPE
jgi:hypothetical protein